MKTLIQDYKQTLDNLEKSLKVLESNQNKVLNNKIEIGNGESKNVPQTTELSWQEGALFTDLFFPRQLFDDVVNVLGIADNDAQNT